jgi:hypothetical protein
MSWKAIGCGVAVVLVWMTASVAPCRAQTGNDLLRHCTDALRVIDNGYQSDTSNQAHNYGWCSGFLHGLASGYETGILDEHTVWGVRTRARLCIPSQGVRTEQFVRIVVKYLRETPQSLHERADDLALTALSGAFPCPSSDTPPPEPAPSGVRQPTTPKPSRGR